ncbi:MAG TPA: integrin alpha, partial [Myxococcota bacterium]|nr:integrin alpha [Myxococcota bacterium]
GAAFIYFGGPALAQSGTAVTLVGNAPGDGLGTTVANAGDVNGDSFSDLLVAAVNGSGLGYVFLYWGGRAFDKTPDQEFSGEAAGDWFGESCAAAGDVNADGYGDVLIGAFANDGVGIDGGRAYLYLGGPAGVAPTPEMILTGAATGDYFGTLVAGVSDLNGDAIDDFVVGAARSDAAGTDAGAVYVFFGWGGGAADAIPDGILTGSAADDRFGIAVASLAPPYVRRMAIWAGASLAPRARLAIASAVR